MHSPPQLHLGLANLVTLTGPKMGVWPKDDTEESLKRRFLIQMIDWQEQPCSLLGFVLHINKDTGS